MRRVLAGLLTLLAAGCAAPIAPADSALSLGSTASAAVAAPTRTAKIASIRTTDATKGVITVVGTLTPAPICYFLMKAIPAEIILTSFISTALPSWTRR